MSLPTDPPPAQRLAEHLARHAAQWARARGAPAEAAAFAAEAARRLSLATSEGHVCLGLDELDVAPDAARERLLASGLVGTADAPGALPFVLDAAGRLYLHRYFDYERRLARQLALRRDAAPAALDAGLRARLAQLFAANAARLGGRADWQQIATALALRGRLTVISGGPGTGKTTTVVNLLACLLEPSPRARIALAAPTGKAAARMSEAIRQRGAHLPPALREALPQEASTVHRLLGVTPTGFVHGPERPLAIDALVVDEASMLDLALATRLFEAVPPAARIVLLGDKDQLAAVEAGAVFAELSADPGLGPGCIADLAAACGIAPQAIVPPAPAAPGGLRDHVVWFGDTYRFAADSPIGRLAASVNAGDAAAALAALRAAPATALAWLDDGGRQPDAAVEERLFDGYRGYLDAVLGGERAAVLAAFERYRVLCALRRGPRGAEALNQRLAARFRAALGARDADPRSPWYPGRPVLVRRNDPVLRLYNGDIGIALPDAASGQTLVVFPDARAGWRALAPARLPEHETAFALTVHQSQGSEFDAVAVVLPAEPGPVLTRELLYTAITRARERVALVGAAPVLEAAVAARTRRRSGLASRLAELAASGPPG